MIRVRVCAECHHTSEADSPLCRAHRMRLCRIAFLEAVMAARRELVALEARRVRARSLRRAA